MAALAGKMDTGGIPVWGVLYGEWNPGVMVFGFVFSFAMALVASWIPARRAGRMTITRALRFV
jgi:ABC-type lipoprotein release transport system permease subunit